MKQIIFAEVSSAIIRTWMTTGETVTVGLYDSAGLVVPLTTGTASEIGATGIFTWALSDITTPPIAYEDYVIVFTGSATGSRVDEFRVGGWPDTLVSHAVGATGASVATITILDQFAAPIPSVGVNIYDVTNTALLTTGITDPSGVVVFNLNDASYKVRLIKNGVTFADTEDLTVAGATAQGYTGEVLAIPTSVVPSVCKVFGYAKIPSGVNPVQSIDATAKIVSLPFNPGGGFHSGQKVTATFDTGTGLFTWDLPYTAVVQFKFDDMAIQGQATIPSVASIDLNDLTLT
jgi:hypothetical protein